MQKKYRVSSHEVEAFKIVDLQPLRGRNDQLLSPEFGLILVLADDTKHNWVAEKNHPMPSVGDFLVSDTELNVIFVVEAAKFQQLFRRPKP